MFDIFKNKPSFSFIKNISLVTAGTAIANIIGIAFSPVITRLFSPSDFGILALITSIVTILSNIAPLSYDRAIVISKSEKETNILFSLSFILLIAISFLLAVFMYFFRFSIAELLKASHLAFWLLFVPIFVFLRGTINITQLLLNRKKKYKNIATITIIDSCFSSIFKILFGFSVGACVGGLVCGMATGLLAACCYILFILQQKYHIFNYSKENIKLSVLKNCTKDYKDFPLFNSWVILLNTITENMIVIIFSVFFSSGAVGLYSLCNRIVRLPIRYIGNSVQTVYYQKAAEQKSKGQDLAKSMKKMTFGLCLIGILPFGIIIFIGPQFFCFMFGEKWTSAGIYTQIMAPGLFFVFINKPAFIMYNVLRKLRARLIYTIFHSISRVMSLLIGYYAFNSVEKCLAMYSGTLIIFNTYFIFQAYFYALANNKEPNLPATE